jgi:hypothetical protein
MPMPHIAQWHHIKKYQRQLDKTRFPDLKRIDTGIHAQNRIENSLRITRRNDTVSIAVCSTGFFICRDIDAQSDIEGDL